MVDESNKFLYRAGIQELAEALNQPVPRVADWRVIPLGLVLQTGRILDVQLPSGTAEERLRYLIDRGGLVDSEGRSLTFKDHHSAAIAAHLAEILRTLARRRRETVQQSKPVRIHAPGSGTPRARTKLEAVNRISWLTASGPETLGPGSKERKSVLVNLYEGLGYGQCPDLSKSELGARLAARLDVQWDERCHSTGETITLEGLNRLLETASLRLGSNSPTPSVASEASLYAGVIMQCILETAEIHKETGQATWDGRRAVNEMLKDSYPQARQTEWPGWYFEFRAIPALMKSFGGGPITTGSTTFDYCGIRTWDLKTHAVSTAKQVSPLNDQESIRLAVENGGLGFIVLDGIAMYTDEDDFYRWHNEEVRGKEPKTTRPTNSRKLKTSFSPQRLDFFFISDESCLADLCTRKVIQNFNQGQQASGAPRKPKYSLDLKRARGDQTVFAYSLAVPEYIARLNHLERRNHPDGTARTRTRDSGTSYESPAFLEGRLANMHGA